MLGYFAGLYVSVAARTLGISRATPPDRMGQTLNSVINLGSCSRVETAQIMLLRQRVLKA
jgi:hypothetical protein